MAIKNGTSKNDKIYGTSAGDYLYGLGGDDYLNGQGGHDNLDGGAGNDKLDGGAGNDRLVGGTGINALFGGAGNDQLEAGAFGDYLAGGDGHDYVMGGTGNDRLRGDGGGDLLTTGGGNDSVWAGAGDDRVIFESLSWRDTQNGAVELRGDGGRDILELKVYGSWGEDHADLTRVRIDAKGNGRIDHITDPQEPNIVEIGTVSGFEIFNPWENSNAFVFEARGNATAYGTNKGDIFEGASGNQIFIGEGGPDMYRMLLRDGWNGGTDEIRGFNYAEGDRIQYNLYPEDHGGPSPLLISARESNGYTIYTTTSAATGGVVNTLKVDAVGLPPPDDYLLG